ncbi:hypothetical protein BGZ76_010932 [Entomortierella beljakovae]|nr:hypothetical protein BGZ76_010932 [Entomortierella beljakovae]
METSHHSARAASPSLSHHSLSHSINIDLDNGFGIGSSVQHLSRSHTPHFNNNINSTDIQRSPYISNTAAAAAAVSSSLHSIQTAQELGQSSLSIDTNIGLNPSLPSPELSPDFYNSKDPMSLASKRMTEDQIAAIHSSKKKVKEFYREQNELITDLLDPPEGREGAAELEKKNQLKLKIAIYGSVGVNVMLFLLQLYAAISSKSLALFATMADSFMDLLSGGKSRMETAGTIVFASLMATVSLELIIESVRTLISSDKEPPMPGVLAIIFVCIALASKLGLFIYCNALSQYNSANILAQDHRNDLIVNGFGLFASLLSRYCWWLDPVGAIIVALIILRSWVWTAYEQIQLIVGKTADPAFLKKLTYIALTHHRKILQVDTCTAYHAGNNLFVEVDVVMAPDTPLIESHDISESLQIKLEALPNVERAFVHVDYETSHAPEHRKSK